MELSKRFEKDYSISIVRLIAFVCIVICHMMQYMECELAWWFNVGVQIFLCISGFLYGKKEIGAHVVFYEKQMKKILIPYYVVILPMIVLYWCFASEKISVVTTIKMLLCYGTVSGGGHLWYIATILLCYFLIPIWSEMLGKKTELRKMIGIFLCNIVIFELFVPYFNSAWINCCFVGGYCTK